MTGRRLQLPRATRSRDLSATPELMLPPPKLASKGRQFGAHSSTLQPALSDRLDGKLPRLHRLASARRNRTTRRAELLTRAEISHRVLARRTLLGCLGGSVEQGHGAFGEVAAVGDLQRR